MAVGALVHDYLVSAAARAPHRAALSVPLAADDAELGVVTFAELDVASDRLAAALQSVGVARGDRVLVMGDNTAEVAVAIWATLKAGGAFVAVDPTTKHDKLAHQLADSAACAVVVPASLAEVTQRALLDAPAVRTVLWMDSRPESAMAALADRVHLDFEALVHGGTDAGSARPADPGLIDDDLAALVYTAGADGRSKGVMHTHRTVVHNSWALCTCLGLRHDDVVACLLPLAFEHGLFPLFAAARMGCTVALQPANESGPASRRDSLGGAEAMSGRGRGRAGIAAEAVKGLADARVSVLPGVASTFSALLRTVPFPEGVDLSKLRLLAVSGGPLAPTQVRHLRGLFPTAQMLATYGLAELPCVSYLPPERMADKMASVGQVLPNTEAYVVDASGRRVAPEVVGELVLRGSGVTPGYWGEPDGTAAHLRHGALSGQVVLHTGDQFWADDEGFLYHVGRHDDLFTCQGRKVSPHEVENVLYELETVGETGVVGVPDDLDGMAVKAVVAPRPGTDLDPDDVRDHCRRRLESHLVPHEIEVREALPKTTAGRIRKAALIQG